MRLTAILAYFLLIGIVCFGTNKAESESEIASKVNAGIVTGQSIINLLQINRTEHFFKKISMVADRISPYLGALGPIVSLITLFLPKGESDELKEMKKRFAIVDANFDKVFNRLAEIKHLIEETSLKNQYSQYEGKIIGLYRRLQFFLNAPTASMEEYKKTFMESYKSSYDNAAYILWSGMMGKGISFHYDIPLKAMEYTSNHRRKVQTILKGAFNLILHGVKIHLVYLKLMNRHNSYENEKKDWDVKVKAVLKRMQEIDRLVQSKYKSEAKSDAVNQMAEYQGKSNAALADKVYSMLKEKFDWRLWFVVVYDNLHGADKHWVGYCGGFFKFRHHGKNMVVSSTGKDELPLDTSCAGNGLEKTKTQFTTYNEYLINGLSSKIDARLVVDKYFPPEYNNCAAPGHGAILKSAHVAFRGPQGRFVVRNNGSYKLYVFQ